MRAAGSIPADEAAAKEAGKTEEEILIYKASQGFKDGSLRALCTDDAEMAYPGAPPFPIDMAMSMTIADQSSGSTWPVGARGSGICSTPMSTSAPLSSPKMPGIIMFISLCLAVL